MAKAIVRMGYDTYAVDAKQALLIHEILAEAELYHRKYRREDEGGTLHHIWPQDATTETKSFEIIPEGLYRMAKLAGKPEEK